jgi:uncharacterized heparinase superfamily protein
MTRKRAGYVPVFRWYREGKHLNLIVSPYTTATYIKNNEFIFLSQKKKFKKRIEWNFSDYGKLWNYHLNYFDYLNQNDMEFKVGHQLIDDFLTHYQTNTYGFEPYPQSRRILNWIKWICQNELNSETIDKALYSQCVHLSRNLEYHLMGNHLLENAFALLFGSYYFQDHLLYKKAKKILLTQLEEQILEDGAHFELSPMYHQEILFRLLDSINMVRNNNWKDKELESLFKEKAQKMLNWINKISFENGEIPLINDSSQNVAPDTKTLNLYSESLGIKSDEEDYDLSTSGFKKISEERYELLIDTGNIGPDYLPGHAHSDTFSFVLWINRKPFIVDTGVSTYENNQRRLLERSTESHNTVKVNNKDQSEVWNSFKVSRRAKIIELKEDNNRIKSTHDGYKRIGAYHTREFILDKQYIKIMDLVESKKDYICYFYLHFYPGVKIQKKLKNGIICDNCSITFLNQEKIQINRYCYAPAFNKLIESNVLEVTFRSNTELNSAININP